MSPTVFIFEIIHFRLLSFSLIPVKNNTKLYKIRVQSFKLHGIYFDNVYIFSYRLRMESMLLKAEFESNLGFLEPSIESMLAAGQGWCASSSLASPILFFQAQSNLFRSLCPSVRLCVRCDSWLTERLLLLGALVN